MMLSASFDAVCVLALATSAITLLLVPVAYLVSFISNSLVSALSQRHADTPCVGVIGPL